MNRMKAVLSIFGLTVSLLFSASLWAQDAGQTPDTAFDPMNNRYLVVWSEPNGSGAVIKGKFVSPDGSELASPEVLSPERPTQGCFYGNFDSDNGNISTPTDCSNNINPTVAYNNGQYLIAWEVHGQASAPNTSPENEFINIFARIVDATSLAPLEGWEEGILISKTFIAANNTTDCGNGKFACNDGEIQAWSQSLNPHVAPRAGGSGFVVAWQSNKDYIGCANSNRRGGISVYGRYIDQNFSATSTTNPAMFAIFKDDSTIEASCATLDNVDNGSHPRIAANQSTGDLVVVYKVARANGGPASIGAKKITIEGSGQGVVSGSMMASIVASADGLSLTNPDLISFKGNYVLAVQDSENNIRLKSFNSDGISNGTPDVIDLGSGQQSQPKLGSNLGANGQGPTTGMAPERILLTYLQDENISGVLLNEGLAIQGETISISAGIATQNGNAELASNSEDLLVTWNGNSDGVKVFSQVIDTEEIIPTGEPPTAPGLLTPNDGVTFAPTRAYLSWDPSTDPDGDDAAITYNVYFGENTLPGTPQITGLTDPEFVIGPETESMTGITLVANKTYVWAIEARDEENQTTLSAERSLNTDNSVVAWWRFDEDPAGPDCPGGAAGESVCDYSGNGNHGVPNGNPFWVMPGMVNILGGALELDGVDDYVAIQNDASLNFSGSFSIEIFAEAGADGGALIARDEAGGVSAGNYQLSNNPATGFLRFAFYHGGVAEPNREFTVNTSSFTSGNQALVTLRHAFGNGSSTDISVDNVSQMGSWVTGTGDELPVLPNNLLGIGSNRADLGGSSFTETIIDEIILYNKVLSPNEMVNGLDSRP